MDSSQSVRLYLPPYTSKEELQAGAFFRVDKRYGGVPFVQGLGAVGSVGCVNLFQKNATLEQAGLYKL